MIVEQIPKDFRKVESFKEFFTQDVIEKKDYKIGHGFIITSLRDPIVRYELYYITADWQEKDLGYRKLQELLPFIEEGKCWLQTHAQEQEELNFSADKPMPTYNPEDIDF